MNDIWSRLVRSTEPAKPTSCEADKVRATQPVPHSLCKQWTVWLGRSSLRHAQLVT